MTVLIIKIILFIAAIIASRLILRRIPNYLTEAEMELVAEKAAPLSQWRNFLIYGTAILFFVLGRVDPVMLDNIETYVLIVFILGMCFLIYASYRLFNKLGISKKPRNLYVLSVAVILVGIVILLIPIGAGF